MVQVPHLPEELLQSVFSNFERTELYDWDERVKRQMLRSICLLNKQCYRVAQPMLFATVDIQEGSGAVGKLLQATVREPRLATLVRVLRIESWRGFDDERTISTEEAKYLQDTAVPAPDILPPVANVHPILGTDLAGQLLADAIEGSGDIFCEGERQIPCPVLPLNVLRDIRLTYALIDAKGLKNLLLSSPCVETLSIEWGDSCVGSCELRYDELGDAIRICHANRSLHNLKSLTLDDRAAQDFAREDLDDEVFPPLGDLRVLSILQTLDVPQSALVGVDESLDADTDDSA
ncbi:hypothetical protein CLAFUW4_04809 [Fulvia fulva]|uniref:Uncharacterized protein n=1 Tax=Passalora fulva TaxID=5499 RepID=A0A9Q8PHV2_PASFU|nr:uncharacterized protein CLAFUR5_12093 [Fulvia fulva]KAK4626519.1 hypothetical protein CLAFUR4_04795 [Fulvia fulva]KAK4628281.1 hypothetical protein CLAFUR0_04799 [Fulvia fulva]UJO22714.1 hypothetical protein CLAFUR5_12093 [Fulvia fulva]WPV13971.1 hypothetical protein CLAFUW4_04809 [Fulvia fulva]WPV29201.1 hypothetical protein CLAFUW7_04803 [Fulvia fulva]